MERLFFALLFLCCCIASFGQVFTEAIKIEICANKTVSLVFPANIISVDRGSDQVLTQKATDNILKVKAASDSCRETNLTVVTADHKIYSFIIVYAEHPAHLTIHLGNKEMVKTVNHLDTVCNKVLRLRPNLTGLKFSAGKVSLQLIGWYISGSTMFCKLKMENRSQIGYDIDELRFYIRDKNTLRRTASQEILQQPLYISGDTSTIPGRSSRFWIIVLNKFTIPDEKLFEVEVLERNGGRNLLIKLYNRQLMVAKAF